VALGSAIFSRGPKGLIPKNVKTRNVNVNRPNAVHSGGAGSQEQAVYCGTM
jgi:hypothetical protein